MPVRRKAQAAQSGEQSRGANNAGTEPLARQQAGLTSVALAAAYVYAEGDYDHLGIGRGGNCLFVWLDGPERSVWHAKMLQLGRTGAAASCLAPRDPHALSGKELEVKRDPIDGFTAADYPPVARWDYDRSAGAEQQYIGLTCGPAWCEIGDLGFKPSAGLPFSPNAPASVKRVRAIKGWYDQQYLATLPTTANEAGPPDVVPTTILGTFIPDPKLQQYDLAVHRRFVQVGSILLQAGARDAAALAKYKRRLGLEAASNALTPQWNELYVCHRGDGDCGIERKRLPQHCLAAASGTPAAKLPTIGGPDRKWVAMVVGAVSHDTTYHCTFRYDVPATLRIELPGGDVPGTTRWRWLAEDEGFWNRCASLGCCETLQ
jgi:hypothetical protein